MFSYSEFNQDISMWIIDSVEDMSYMFCESRLNQDISNWDISHVKYTTEMFNVCPIEDEYKPKALQSWSR